MVDGRQEDPTQVVDTFRRRFTLETRRIPYSNSEMILFKFLPRDGSRISSVRLTQLKARLEGKEWGVVHPRNTVTVTMRHLIDKVKKNREEFEVRQSRRRGPHPVEYWIEVR